MFVSLNKKILYTIIAFLILTFSLLGLTFYSIYGKKFLDEQYLSSLNTIRVSEANYENTVLRQELKSIIKNHPEVNVSANTKALLQQTADSPDKLNEFRRMSEMARNYNSRYSSAGRDIRMVFASVLFICVLVIILGMLLKRWLLEPIGKLSLISDLVASGDLSRRVEVKNEPLFTDELSKLTLTFNQMLEYVNNSFNEIKEKERFLQSLIDSIPDGIRVIDENYNIIIANQTYYDQTGYKPNSRIKCYASSQGFEAPCPEDKFSCPIREIKKNNFQSFTSIQQFQNASENHYSINAAPMTIDGLDGNKYTYVVESIRDLSSDVRFSHQQKLSSLGFLATSVAHEIKNRIGSVRMITEALLKKYHSGKKGNTEEKKYLELIYKELNESIRLPENLLSLNRNNTDELGVIDCVKNIKEVIALLDYETKRRGAVVELSYNKENVTLMGSAIDFKMMLINLFLNAIKAMKANGLLQISLKQNQKKDVTIEIKDNGVGISESDLSKIFEPFFTTNLDNEAFGTGLGLPIVKSIVIRLKGTIEVKSKLGKGTKVILKFVKQ